MAFVILASPCEGLCDATMLGRTSSIISLQATAWPQDAPRPIHLKVIETGSLELVNSGSLGSSFILKSDGQLGAKEGAALVALTPRAPCPPPPQSPPASTHSRLLPAVCQSNDPWNRLDTSPFGMEY